MTAYTRVRSCRTTIRRTVFAVAVLLTAVLAGPWQPAPAHADTAYVVRPSIHISDGSVLHLNAAISTDGGNVQGVVFTVHAPRGLHWTHIEFSGARKAAVLIVFDNAPGSYTTDTLALTAGGEVPVITSATLDTTSPTAAAASGLSNHSIHVQFWN